MLEPFFLQKYMLQFCYKVFSRQTFFEEDLSKETSPFFLRALPDRPKMPKKLIKISVFKFRIIQDYCLDFLHQRYNQQLSKNDFNMETWRYSTSFSPITLHLTFSIKILFNSFFNSSGSFNWNLLIFAKAKKFHGRSKRRKHPLL